MSTGRGGRGIRRRALEQMLNGPASPSRCLIPRTRILPASRPQSPCTSTVGIPPSQAPCTQLMLEAAVPARGQGGLKVCSLVLALGGSAHICPKASSYTHPVTEKPSSWGVQTFPGIQPGEGVSKPGSHFPASLHISDLNTLYVGFNNSSQ